jgi:hypothetical protein
MAMLLAPFAPWPMPNIPVWEDWLLPNFLVWKLGAIKQGNYYMQVSTSLA